MSYKDFAKGAMIIAVAQLLSALANFLILPVVTRALGTHDYGIWTVISVTISLLTPLAVLGLSTAILRFFPSKADKKELREEFFTILFFVTALGLGLASVMIAFSETIAIMIFNEQALYNAVIAAAFLVPLSAINALTTSFFRAVGRIRTYASLIVLGSFGQLTLILMLAHLGVVGVLIGTLIVLTITSITAVLLIARQVGFCLPKRHLIRSRLKFSLPLTPNAIITWITASSDRYLVGLILGLSFAGIYSAAYGIGMLVFLFVTPIQMVLYPTISKLYDDGKLDDVVAYLGRSLRYFLMLTIPAVAGLTVLAQPLLVSMTTPDFAPGSVVIPLVAIAGLFAGVNTMVMTILHLVKKTHLNLLIHTVPAVLNIFLVILATPFLGIFGTALATTLAYATLLVLGTKVSFRHIAFSADWSFIGKSVLSATLMAGAIALLSPVTMVQIITSICIGAPIYFVSLIALKGVTNEEMAFAIDSLRHVAKSTRDDKGR